ncbi:MAG: hypothetical protein H6719_05145 [Sandaracinaceae bacterium]|nr:hypothetical protein [Sandaracinaceae bacterium]
MIAAHADKLQRRLLAAVLATRFVVFIGLDRAANPAPLWELLTIGAALAAYLAVVAWRVAPASRRGADVVAALLLLSAVGAKIAMTTAAASDSSSLATMHIYFGAKVWALSGEALALLLVAASPSIGQPTRAHPLALACLVLVGLDLGWRTISDSGFELRGAIDPFVWTAAELGLVGLLLAGVGWTHDPNPTGPSRLRWVVLACVASWSLPLTPVVGAAVDVAPPLVLVGAAACALLAWSVVLGSARSVTWPVGAAGMVASAVALGVAARCWWYPEPAMDLGIGGGSAARWGLDAAAVISVVASTRLVAVYLGWAPRSAQAVTGAASLLLASSHWREPLVVLGILAAWSVTAAGLHWTLASGIEHDVSAT